MYLENPENVFRDYFRSDAMLTPLIKEVKRLAENLKLNNCPTDICREESQTTTLQNTHHLVMRFLQITFSVRGQFPEAFKAMKNCVL